MATIQPPSSYLYPQLSVAFNFSLKPKYIYTILKLDRFNVFNDLLKIRSIKVEENDSNISDTLTYTQVTNMVITYKL